MAETDSSLARKVAKWKTVSLALQCQVEELEAENARLTLDSERLRVLGETIGDWKVLWSAGRAFLRVRDLDGKFTGRIYRDVLGVADRLLNLESQRKSKEPT